MSWSSSRFGLVGHLKYFVENPNCLMTLYIACHSKIAKHMRGTFAQTIIDTSTLLINRPM